MSDNWGAGLVTLGVDNIIHENSGFETTSTTSHVVSLAGSDSTTAGNTVVVCIPATGVTAPSGFAVAGSAGSVLVVYYKSDVAAGETSWTFTTSTAITLSWYVGEVSNLDPALPVDVVATSSAASIGNGGTGSTGTTGVSIGLSTMALAFFAFSKAGTDVVSWSGWTNGFTEVADVSPSGGSSGLGLGVARLFVNGATQTFQTSATLSVSSGTVAPYYAIMVVFHAADSPLVTQMAAICGFGWGTHAGMANGGNAANNPQGGLLAPVGGTWGTNYFIQAASARNSGYGLRIVRSASACQVLVGNLSSRGAAFGLNVRVVSATGTVTVAAFYSSGVTTTTLMYDATNNKFGVKAGSSGTVSWQSGTTALNTWVWVEVRAKTNTSTYHAEWRLETGTDTYTDQPSADLTGQSTSNAQALVLGGGGTDTATIDYDDVVISAQYATYPLGPHQVRLLTVDPAGTPTVSGTTTNFSTFASNGTLTAWNATTARNAVDEVPPTISASADGVTQTATAATDYMEFPMATYTCAANEYIDGVRAVVPLWSGTGAGAGDLAIRGWEGTTETALAAASQITPGAPTAGSSTAPVWRQAMWPAANRWTQAKLDAAALRVGFSGDATPDMGVEAIYLEISVGSAAGTQRVAETTGLESVTGVASVDAITDPTGSVMSYTATAPADFAAAVTYTKSGSDIVVSVPAGSQDVRVIDAETAADVTNVTIGPA